MTLVLSLATKDYLVQVCDRRLVHSTGKLYDDDANKSVMFSNRMALSYTGLGYIGAEKTDIWLTKALSQAPSDSLSDALYTLTTSATDAFKHLNFPLYLKRHAFVAVAWTRSTQTEPFRPMIGVVSNFYDEQLNPLAEARDSFTLKVRIMPNPAEMGYISIGQRILKQQEIQLLRNLRRCVSHNVSVDLVLSILVKAVRSVALSNNFVGRGLLSVVIPREAVNTDNPYVSILAGGPLHHTPTFQYYSAFSNQAQILGPNFASCGTALTNFKAGPL